MSIEAFLPCFKCGKALRNISVECDNQPSEGTEFRTYGHYGSTFWDSFDGEELVLNICDKCLGEHSNRLAQHKRFLPVHSCGVSGLGKQWVDRPMVAYSGNRDDTLAHVDLDELGTNLSNVEWPEDIAERQYDLQKKEK